MIESILHEPGNEQSINCESGEIKNNISIYMMEGK